MSKPSFRLHIRACELKKTIVSLDVTRKDFHSSALELYVTHWFIDVDDLVDYLTTSTDSSIILIVSNLLANISKYVLSQLLPQISEVYILGAPLMNTYSSKHKDQYFLDVDSLLNVLNTKAQKVNTSMRHSSERSTNDLTEGTSKYIWYQFFFNVLSHLTHTNVARSEMFKAIQGFHSRTIKDNVSMNCEEFERNYKPEDIAEWYTRIAFLYIPFNRALRSEHINHIFAFRYIIPDLERALNELQKEQLLTEYKFLYRGQQLCLDELLLIASRVGNLIGMTAFWPYTPDFNTAFRAATDEKNCSKSLHPVVFVINTSVRLQRPSFVDVSYLSSSPRKQQIIFLSRSLFRIEGVNEVYNVWYVDLTLVDETDEQFIKIADFWKTSIGIRNFFSLPIDEKQHFFHDLSEEKAAFLRFQLLIDMILRLNHNNFAKYEMLEMCKAKFASNPAELAYIGIFEKTYIEKNAITWYTKDCFLYRLLNESLWTESIDLIVKLRYFIQDLHNQLAELHSVFLQSLPPGHQMLTLYRGLIMTMSELEKFRQNETNFVSNNSFLSTTRDYEAALFFSGDGRVEEPQVSVIYKIFVDTSIAHSVPFAAIEYKSIYGDEDEVLFSMAAVFRIGRTKQLDDRLWKIELTLTPTTEGHWNILTEHLKK